MLDIAFHASLVTITNTDLDRPAETIDTVISLLRRETLDGKLHRLTLLWDQIIGPADNQFPVSYPEVIPIVLRAPNPTSAPTQPFQLPSIGIPRGR